MKAKYKSAVIGCGARCHAHIESYVHVPDAKAVACCDPDRGRREAVAGKYGLRPYADAKEMLEKEKPDMVHIVTWPDVRLELMELVSRMGAPLCVVEKPVAAGVRDWKALVRLEADSQTKFAVSHQLRWQRDLSKCVEALQSGRLGKPLLVDISARMNLAGQGTHTLDYGMALNGDSPVSLVFGSVCGWDMEDKGHPAPLCSEALLVFENGARAVWTSGGVSPSAGDPEIFWQHVRVAACAERGRVLYEEFGNWEIVEGGKRRRGSFRGMEEWAKNNVEAQAGLHKAMFAWLEDGSQAPGTNLRQSLHEWAAVLALCQSALEGRPVEMRGFDPPDDLLERCERRGRRQ